MLLGREPLVFHETGKGTYSIELPLEKLLAGRTKIICQWHLSLEDLKKAQDDYRTVLQSLIPVTSYKLKVGADPQSGFELTKETSGMWITPFTRNTAEPAAEFGSCGLMVKKR